MKLIYLFFFVLPNHWMHYWPKNVYIITIILLSFDICSLSQCFKCILNWIYRNLSSAEHHIVSERASGKFSKVSQILQLYLETKSSYLIKKN